MKTGILDGGGGTGRLWSLVGWWAETWVWGLTGTPFSQEFGWGSIPTWTWGWSHSPFYSLWDIRPRRPSQSIGTMSVFLVFERLKRCQERSAKREGHDEQQDRDHKQRSESPWPGKKPQYGMRRYDTGWIGGRWTCPTWQVCLNQLISIY